MQIVNLTANSNGSHNNQKSDNIFVVHEGWAMIPDAFDVPASFPFVDIETDGNGVVVAMTEKEVPIAPKAAAVTQLDVIEAQVYYTAMMTGTLLEE